MLERYRQGVTLSDFRPRNARHIRKLEPEYALEELALLEMLRT